MLGELSTEQIEQLLTTNVVGRIGCYSAGKVYVVPVTYVYEDGFVYGHTTEGLKVNMLRKNPACCFEVDHYENMANWQSVIAWGKYEELKGDEATIAMQRFVKKLTPMLTSQTSWPSHGVEHHHGDSFGKKAIIYKLTLNEKTGRFEKR